MANTKKVPEEQIPMEDMNKEEMKPAENPVPAVEPTVSTEETPVKGEDGKKEEKKTLRRWVGEKLITSDDKAMQKKAEKLAKKQEKLQAKAAKKAQKGESTGWSKVKKGLIIGGSIAGAAIVGGVAYVANKSGDGNAVYVDNGTPTTYIPEQATQNTVEEASIEPAVVTETNSSETAGTIVETTSNE